MLFNTQSIMLLVISGRNTVTSRPCRLYQGETLLHASLPCSLVISGRNTITFSSVSSSSRLHQGDSQLLTGSHHVGYIRAKHCCRLVCRVVYLHQGETRLLISPSGRTTRRPSDHCKETQTAVVWSCLVFIRSGQNRLARHSERGKKTRQTEDEEGRQHQGMDRLGVRQVPQGSGTRGKME